MKKIFIFIALIGLCFNVDAQLYVDNSTGNVGVKDNTPEKALTISGEVTISNAGARFLDFDNLFSGPFSNAIDKNGLRWIAENQNYGSPDSLRFHQLYNYGEDKMFFDVNDNFADGVIMSMERATGNVGIRTDVPITDLHVEGASYVSGDRYIYASGTTNPDKMVMSHSPTYPDWGLNYNDVDDAMAFQSPFGSSLYISLGLGMVGVNTETLTHTLSIGGDIGLTGVVYGISDARVKKNFLTIDNALDKINQLNPVSYEFDQEENPDLNLPDNRHMGLLAQEVQSVFPQLVSISETEEEIMSLNYMELIPALVKSIQELDEKLNEKDAQIEAMQKQIDKLK